MKSINTRLNQLEERNTAIDVRAKDNRTITIKEVYERLISLEVKYDMKLVENRKNTRLFLRYVYLLLFLALIDIAFSIIAAYVHIQMGG